MPIILKWLGYDGLRFTQTLNDTEQEICRTSTGQFEVPSKKFSLQHNKTVVSLQYCKLTRKQDEAVKEWMGHLDSKPLDVVTKKDREGSVGFL